MKKLITMMLVLLIVGGAVFGADTDGGTLTLSADVTGVLKHGFIANKIADADFGKINSGLSGTALDYTFATKIDLESNDSTDVGYYYFVANTPKTGYTIQFQVNPFYSDVAGFEVPLTLAVAKDVAHANVTVTAVPIAIATSGVIGADISASEKTTVMDTAQLLVGPKYAGLKLSVTTTGTANAAYGIPAANDYEATVVAYVTTK